MQAATEPAQCTLQHQTAKLFVHIGELTCAYLREKIARNTVQGLCKNSIQWCYWLLPSDSDCVPQAQ
jgi:hypothetical protein